MPFFYFLCLASSSSVFFVRFMTIDLFSQRASLFSRFPSLSLSRRKNPVRFVVCYLQGLLYNWLSPFFHLCC